MTEVDRFPVRAERARATRRRVVLAATDLFVQDGYGATSIAAIAKAAGVAVQTVYAAFGNKPAILAAAVDQAIAGDDLPVAANDRDWMRVVLDTTDPAARLRAYGHAVGRIHRGAAQVFRVLDVAATNEGALAELWAETGRRRREGVTGVLRPLSTARALRPGLGLDRAVDVAWTLVGHDVYLHLVAECGWTGAQYEEWLGDSLVVLLLGPSSSSPLS